jgi:hypothetical protein
MSKDYNDEDLLKEAVKTFCRAVKAKKPDVVICCYQGEELNEPLVDGFWDQKIIL